MKKVSLYVFLIFLSISTFSQGHKISSNTVDMDYYKWITFLSEGKINWTNLDDDTYIGESFRFVITTSEIYIQLYIEKITYGMEGCCKNIANKREIPIGEIFSRFNIVGERCCVTFGGWRSPTSCEVIIHDTKYLIKDLNTTEISMSKL
ncbi:MAG: hypothetical protein U5L75_00750 [Candidatus Campbellbacteria bacterium]|nr:hypothetical protein [Candidatus Campbellbacteria bacterium]